MKKFTKYNKLLITLTKYRRYKFQYTVWKCVISTDTTDTGIITREYYKQLYALAFQSINEIGHSLEPQTYQHHPRKEKHNLNSPIGIK